MGKTGKQVNKGILSALQLDCLCDAENSLLTVSNIVEYLREPGLSRDEVAYHLNDMGRELRKAVNRLSRINYIHERKIFDSGGYAAFNNLDTLARNGSVTQSEADKFRDEFLKNH